MHLLKETGVKAIAIDDSEVTNLTTILKSFGDDYRLSRVTIVHNPKGSITKDFNRTHEYCLFLTSENDKEAIGRSLEKKQNTKKDETLGRKLTKN